MYSGTATSSTASWGRSAPYDLGPVKLARRRRWLRSDNVERGSGIPARCRRPASPVHGTPAAWHWRRSRATPRPRQEVGRRPVRRFPEAEVADMRGGDVAGVGPRHQPIEGRRRAAPARHRGHAGTRRGPEDQHQHQPGGGTTPQHPPPRQATRACEPHGMMMVLAVPAGKGADRTNHWMPAHPPAADGSVWVPPEDECARSVSEVAQVRSRSTLYRSRLRGAGTPPGSWARGTRRVSDRGAPTYPALAGASIRPSSTPDLHDPTGRPELCVMGK